MAKLNWNQAVEKDAPYFQIDEIKNIEKDVENIVGLVSDVNKNSIVFYNEKYLIINPENGYKNIGVITLQNAVRNMLNENIVPVEAKEHNGAIYIKLDKQKSIEQPLLDNGY